MKIHALWCHPRSVSTAFERIMRERGDLDVLHEPFMYHHYLTTTGRLFPNFKPEPGHPTTYEDIAKMIRTKAQEGAVFFKDMAYYVADVLAQDTALAGEMTHCFLIRDPDEAALSYAKRDPDFSCAELGHEAQHQLFHALRGQGHDPLILTADQLRNDPELTLRRYWAHVGLNYKAHAFSWDNHVPAAWEAVSSWHSEVLESGAIQKPEARNTASELADLGPPFTTYAAHHQPFYQKMRDIAHQQAQ